ncbi:hypothetical protein Taro_031391 [Colocasia esculenta]|uniref:Serine aminopeptidase S33 domain-containing protein n=1 Tax=Colocasia esculenta TaxID=4460 RepID=A0A843VYX1_COLES|nr:hypothetical protein [Colocasia esculenta]
MLSIGTSLPANGTRLGLVISDHFDEKAWKRRRCQQQRYLGLSERRKQAAAMVEPVMRAGPSALPAPLMLTSGASGRVSALLSLCALRSFLLLVVHGVVLVLLAPFQSLASMRFVSRAGPTPSGGSSEKTRGDEKQLEGSRAGKKGSAAPVVVRVPAAMVPRRAVVPLEAAARRALAIKRMAVEEEGGEQGRSKKDYALLVTARGDTLFTRSWSPVTASPKGVVVLLHGLNEHSFLFHGMQNPPGSAESARSGSGLAMADLADLGWIGIRMNLRIRSLRFKKEVHWMKHAYQEEWVCVINEGSLAKRHGGSDGLHGYVHSLDYAVSDTKAFLEKVLEENPGLPCFCFGHSTGAAIILKAVLDPKIESLVQGIVLTSPALRVQPSHPIVAVMAPLISFLLPRYQFGAADKKGMPVCRDPAALLAKYSDPLVYTGSIRVRTGYEILRITSHLQQNLKRVNVPFRVLHGTDDTVTDPEATKLLYGEACSRDKSIKLYEGLLHDLLFEPEGKDIADDIVGWLSSRAEVSSTAD